MSYLNKYLKYKNKYLQLKNQYGGKKTVYFKDVTRSDNRQFFKLVDCEINPETLNINRWNHPWENPIFQNDFCSIYGEYNISSNMNGFIIETANNIIVIQVGETITNSPVLNSSTMSYDMILKQTFGFDSDGNEESTFNDISINSIHILLSGCILILTYTNQIDLKIFIDTFDHQSCHDTLNRRVQNKLLHRSDLSGSSGSSGSEEYNEPLTICNSLEFMKVIPKFFEVESSSYKNSYQVYQILQQGINSVLVIKEYEIHFTGINEEIIYISQIDFSLPKFKDLVFNDIDIVNDDFDTYNLLIIYNDVAGNRFNMGLEIIKDYSKEMVTHELFDDNYYIFTSNIDKIQIYPSRNFDFARSRNKKLIGIINFDNDEKSYEKLNDMFAKSYLTRI